MDDLNPKQLRTFVSDKGPGSLGRHEGRVFQSTDNLGEHTDSPYALMARDSAEKVGH